MIKQHSLLLNNLLEHFCIDYLSKIKNFYYYIDCFNSFSFMGIAFCFPTYLVSSFYPNSVYYPYLLFWFNLQAFSSLSLVIFIFSGCLLMLLRSDHSCLYIIEFKKKYSLIYMYVFLTSIIVGCFYLISLRFTI